MSDVPKDSSPEQHVSPYPSVMKLIYSTGSTDETQSKDGTRRIDEIIKAVRPDDAKEKTSFCRWHHIPSNNVSSRSSENKRLLIISAF
jgi:hypothetical protein